MSGIKRVYWDTCCFISEIKGEDRGEPDNSDMRAARHAFDNYELVIVTSALTVAEITATKVKSEGLIKFNNFLYRSNLEDRIVDVGVSEKARKIRDFFNNEFNMLDAITVPDSIHLATSIIYKCEEYHTYDTTTDKKSKRPGLAQLSGSPGVDGMKICKPYAVKGVLDI